MVYARVGQTNLQTPLFSSHFVKERNRPAAKVEIVHIPPPHPIFENILYFQLVHKGYQWRISINMQMVNCAIKWLQKSKNCHLSDHLSDRSFILSCLQTIFSMVAKIKCCIPEISPFRATDLKYCNLLTCWLIFDLLLEYKATFVLFNCCIHHNILGCICK